MAFLTEAVYRTRLDSVNQLMERKELDAFLVFAPDFFQFFSNFHVDVVPWERPIAMVIPRNGEPIAVMNALSTGHLEFARARNSLWLKNITSYCEFPLDEKDSRPRTTFFEQFLEVMDGAGLAGKNIGMDSASGWAAKLADKLPGTSFTPYVNEMRALRYVKHEEELSVMRDISRLSDWIQERYLEEVRPGRLVHELDLTIARMTYEKVAEEFPGENFEYRFYTLSGPSSASPHGDGGQAGARIEEGHGLVNIIIPRLNGVTIENERTLFCGQPSDLQRRAYDAALSANEASIAQMVAGNAVRDIDEAARNVFAKAGFHENVLHRTGHGVGLLGHDFPGDMPFSDRALLENEVYSAEPGIYFNGVGGFRIDDTVVVGSTQPEILTKAPKSIEAITIT